MIHNTQLKKLKVKELKDIMRKHSIKGLSGNKISLISKILSSSKWNIIQSEVTLPEKVKRVFSEKQLLNQQRFSKHNPDTLAIERDNKIKIKICPKGKPICDCDEKKEVKEIILKKRATISKPTEISDLRNQNDILRDIIELFI